MLMLNLAMEVMEDTEVDTEEVMEAMEVDMVDTDMVVMGVLLKLPLKLMLVMAVTDMEVAMEDTEVDMEAMVVAMEAMEVAMVAMATTDKLQITNIIIVIHYQHNKMNENKEKGGYDL